MQIIVKLSYRQHDWGGRIYNGDNKGEGWGSVFSGGGGVGDWADWWCSTSYLFPQHNIALVPHLLWLAQWIVVEDECLIATWNISWSQLKLSNLIFVSLAQHSHSTTPALVGPVRMSIATWNIFHITFPKILDRSSHCSTSSLLPSHNMARSTPAWFKGAALLVGMNINTVYT